MLICTDCKVQRVCIRKRLGLMNAAPGHVQQVPRVQGDIQQQLAELLFLEVSAAVMWQQVCIVIRCIQAPPFAALHNSINYILLKLLSHAAAKTAAVAYYSSLILSDRA